MLWCYLQSDGIYSGGREASIFCPAIFSKATLFSCLRDISSGATASTEQRQLAQQLQCLCKSKSMLIWSLEQSVIKHRAAPGLHYRRPGGWQRRTRVAQQEPCEKAVNESLDFSGWLRWLLLIFFEFRCVISVHTLGMTGRRWVNIFLIVPGLRQGCDKMWGKMWLGKNVLVSVCPNVCLGPHRGAYLSVLSWEETQGDRWKCFLTLYLNWPGLIFLFSGNRRHC